MPQVKAMNKLVPLEDSAMNFLSIGQRKQLSPHTLKYL